MTGTAEPAVVVGVDGSPASVTALDLAAQEAAWRKLPLRVVHGFQWPLIYPPLGAVPAPTDPGLRARAGELLEDAAERARHLDPSLTVLTHLVDGNPTRVLVDASRTASLLVTGHRGHGGFFGLLAGSVSTQVAAHAHCPVLVVRPTSADAEDHPATWPVVVGVDGSAVSAEAIGYAFEEAALRGVSLTAVHVWGESLRTGPGPFEPSAGYEDQLRTAAERILSESLAGYQEKYPGVSVFREVRYGPEPVPVLLDAAEGAALLVVGCRGRGGFHGLLLGSVSQTLLHHAPCPIALIHPLGHDRRGRAPA